MVLTTANPAPHARPFGHCAWVRAAARCLRQGLSFAALPGLLIASGRRALGVLILRLRRGSNKGLCQRVRV